MKRKDFFKDICKYGLCSCAAFALFSHEKTYAFANDQDQELKNVLLFNRLAEGNI